MSAEARAIMMARMDAGAIWRREVIEGGACSPCALREKADTLRWQARWRVMSGYLWGGLVSVQFGFDLCFARNAMEAVGDLICIVGAIFLAVWCRRFAIETDIYAGLPARAFMSAYRAELLRQKRLSHPAGLWSLMPLVAGLVISGSFHLAARHALYGRPFATMLAFAGLVVGLAWIFGRLQAEQVQLRIDEVEATLRNEGQKIGGAVPAPPNPPSLY